MDYLDFGQRIMRLMKGALERQLLAPLAADAAYDVYAQPSFFCLVDTSCLISQGGEVYCFEVPIVALR